VRSHRCSSPVERQRRRRAVPPGAFVTVEGDSQLVGVDLTTARVVARVRVPKGPREIVRAPGPLEQLLVTSPQAGAVSLVDARGMRVIEVWRGFGRPSDVAVEGGHAYVTDEQRGRLAVIDLSTRSIVGRADVGPRPKSVAVGDLALVTHGRAQVRVNVVDIHRPRTPETIARVSVPGPFDISEQPDSNRAYMTNWQLGGVGRAPHGVAEVVLP